MITNDYFNHVDKFKAFSIVVPFCLLLAEKYWRYADRNTSSIQNMDYVTTTCYYFKIGEITKGDTAPPTPK